MRTWYTGLFPRGHAVKPGAAMRAQSFASTIARRWRARRLARLQALDFALRPGFALRLLRVLPLSIRLRQHFRSAMATSPVASPPTGNLVRWMMTRMTNALGRGQTATAAPAPQSHRAQPAPGNVPTPALTVRRSVVTRLIEGRGRRVEGLSAPVPPPLAAAATWRRRRVERVERMAPMTRSADPLTSPAQSVRIARAEARPSPHATSLQVRLATREALPASGSAVGKRRIKGMTIPLSDLPVRVVPRVITPGGIASASDRIWTEATPMQRFQRMERRSPAPRLAPAFLQDVTAGARETVHGVPVLRRRPSTQSSPSAAALEELEAAIAVKIERRMERRIADVVEESLAPDSRHARRLVERAYADLHDGILLERERLG